VEVKSPPRMTMAIGPSISRPGAPLPRASGRSPRAVTVEVMRIGAKRSEAPRTAASRPHSIPSFSTRCCLPHAKLYLALEGEIESNHERRSAGRQWESAPHGRSGGVEDEDSDLFRERPEKQSRIVFGQPDFQDLPVGGISSADLCTRPVLSLTNAGH
jgi:hypothetical protein